MNTEIINFDYKGSQISFNKGKNVMINATEMAKPFGKLVGDWIRLKSTSEFTEALSADMQIPISALIQTVKGGNGEQGTWMHEDVALEFARWLSPSFAIWCNNRIKELLTTGVTTVSNDDETIARAMCILQQRLDKANEEKQALEQKNAQQQILIEQKDAEITEKDGTIKVLTPKGETYDAIMSSQGLVTINMIAAFLGISAKKLNQLLCQWGVQYRQSKCYFLTSKYRSKGYTKHVPYPYLDNGVQKSREHMYWTESGRKFVIDLYNSKTAA